MAEHLLVVEAVDKRFGGVQALSGLSFGVGASEVVGLIGPNGSGKSTCVNVLSGTLLPTAGSVSLGGQDLHGISVDERVRLGLSRTFQTTTMFAVLILGGLGSIPGAIVGGLVLGMSEALAAGLISSAYKDVIAFLVMIIVLLFKPEGLLGKK